MSQQKDEFGLINKYCRDIGVDHAETIINVGDDAAVISPPAGYELAISTDVLVQGRHFFENMPPADLAYKAMAVNISDMSAMGARAKWATIGLSIPDAKEAWFKSFTDALRAQAHDVGYQVIGGDLTKGPLSIAVTIFGIIPRGKALTRAGARVGDDIYVSGVLGDAAMSVAQQYAGGAIDPAIASRTDFEHFKSALYQPQIRQKLGIDLIGVASACIDCSDGLLADLGHVAEQSEVACCLEIDRLPLSVPMSRWIAGGGDYRYPLAGGDDYELIFTASPNDAGRLEEIADTSATLLTRIGTVVPANESSSTIALEYQGQPFSFSGPKGFNHFRA